MNRVDEWNKFLNACLKIISSVLESRIQSSTESRTLK